MLPEVKDIIKITKLPESRIFNIYLFGSHVYGTATQNSDYDFIVVANHSVPSIEIQSGLFNIHIYTPDQFKADLLWHRPNNLECIYSPEFAKLQEKISYSDFTIDTKKLRHATCHVSSNSWVKSKKKLLQGDYHIGIKSIFHSLRIPIFATQIAKTGGIYDYTAAGWIWDKLSSCHWTWDELDLEFRDLRNSILTEFRKFAEK
jgi:predicted nucleotidyltransferase